MTHHKAIVTGATKGIGRAIAEAFAALGMDLVICSRHASDLHQCRKALKEIHPGIEVLDSCVDLSVPEEVDRFAHFIAGRWSAVDVLVNNAGVYLPGQSYSEPEGQLEQLMRTNLYSAYQLTRKILPLMLPHRHGHIFNMCSVASFMAYPNGGSYSITKFALLGFSKVLREELKGQGIKVTAVMPGATWSESWAGVSLPETRLMQAADIAESVVSALRMGPSAVVEEIIIRPQLGDL